MLVPNTVIQSERDNKIEIVTKHMSALKSEQMNVISIDDEKEYTKTIKDIEKIVRSSPEYRRYLKYLRETIEIKRGAIFGNIDLNEIKGVTLEFHHVPFTLYDLVDIVIQKNVSEGFSDKLDLEIADEVMKLHFSNLVGLAPLTKTTHELVHNGEIFINLRHVFGKHGVFVEEYKKGISQDLLDKYDQYVNMSLEYGEKYKPAILDKQATYLQIEGVDKVLDKYELPEKVEDKVETPIETEVVKQEVEA